MMQIQLFSKILVARRNLRRGALLVSLVVSLALAASSALAQLPRAGLTWVYPAGGKQGTTVDVTLSGKDLDGADKLSFSHPGITATQKMSPPTGFKKEPQPIANQFTVSIAAEVPPGIYEVRALGKFGISNPRAFVVGTLEEATEPGNNTTPENAMEIALDTTVNGRTANDTFDFYKFTAKKGQRVLIDCWATQIDARTDATLIVTDADGRRLAMSRDENRTDPLIDFTAPADGDYFIKVYDFIFRGGPDYFYRLSVSSAPYIDFVFPPSGEPGSKGQYTIYGRNLPGGTPAEGVIADGVQLEKLTVEIQLPADIAEANPAKLDAVVEPRDAAVDGIEYRLETPQGSSNAVFVSLATAPVVMEQEPNNEAEKSQKVTVPCEYVGQFYPRGDVDWVMFEAKKGDVYQLEVFSQRLGLPTDPFLLVQQVITDDKGEQTIKDVKEIDDVDLKLGNPGFDLPTDDPSFRFAAPADGTYRVLVRDLYSGSSAHPRFVYRLSIRQEHPDFRLVATLVDLTNKDNNKVLSGTPVLRKGGTTAIRVQAYRRDGFNGEIELGVEGLPEGVTCPPVTLKAGQNLGTLLLGAAENAADWAGAIQILGKAKIAEKDVTRYARGSTLVWDKASANDVAFARVIRNITLAVTGEPAPIRATAGEGKTYEASRAGKVSIPVKVTRLEGAKGDLKLDPVGLPKELKGASVTVKDKTADAQFEITVDPKAAPGTYTFYLTGQSKFAYKRNEDMSKKAAEEQAAFDKLVAELAEEAKKAAEAKAAADKEAATQEAESKKAAAALAAAEKAATDAETLSKTAAAEATKAKEAAEKAPGDKALADAAAAAEKAASDAAAKAKAAADARDAAKKAADEAAAREKAAKEAQTKAAADAKAADEKSKAAAAEKKNVDKRATDLANAAKPKDIDVAVNTLPVSLTIVEAPVTLAPAAPAAPLKQGSKTNIEVAVERLFGYADEFDLEVVLPKGVKGLKVAKVKVPKDGKQGSLVVEAAADASPGAHQLIVRGTVKYNGQNLVVDRPLELTIEAVKAPEKK